MTVDERLEEHSRILSEHSAKLSVITTLLGTEPSEIEGSTGSGIAGALCRIQKSISKHESGEAVEVKRIESTKTIWLEGLKLVGIMFCGAAGGSGLIAVIQQVLK